MTSTPQNRTLAGKKKELEGILPILISWTILERILRGLPKKLSTILGSYPLFWEKGLTNQGKYDILSS